MVKEAQSHAADDARRREDRMRNQADALLYQTERLFQEQGGKLTDTERQAVDHSLSDARDAIKAQDADRLRRAQQDLQETAKVFGVAAQRQQTQARAAGAGAAGAGSGPAQPPRIHPSTSSSDNDVIDAEFKMSMTTAREVRPRSSSRA